ncbi:hypothetical protein [Sedimenticola sp.]|uniref:hypothetical protein n=1 Tax=Sedimenticola sp. TaxID=1940285 RepID=UPI00258885CC|nr:hypothetical protein [Sedimenticola sp.]MCW8904766.1 hypothetical protein [Sedimenticola sp.]
MNHRQQWQATASRENGSTSIRRTLDDSIDFHFYRRRAHCLRSEAAWDIISHMSRMLPFFRSAEVRSHPNQADCTML